MKNKDLTAVMARGNITYRELDEILHGAGGGNNEQYKKVHVVCSGEKITDIDWFPGREDGKYDKNADGFVLKDPIPSGDFVLVWDYTGQSVKIDRQMAIDLFNGVADRGAAAACREVENCEFRGSTKTLPKSWTIDLDGEIRNQFGDSVN